VDVKPLETLGRHVAAHLDAGVDRDFGDHALRAKLAAHAGSPKKKPVLGGMRLLVPGFGLAAVALGLFLVVSRPARPPLTFTVGTPGRPGVLGESVAAPERSGTSLRFSEGSRMALDPEARASVARLDATGAELVLETGRAHVDVVPRPENAWHVRTGPFVVAVTGTRFDLEWDAAHDHFSLELYEGKVTVSGCSFGAGQKLVAGQRAEAACKAGTQSVAPLPASASAPSPRAPSTSESLPAPPATATPVLPAATDVRHAPNDSPGTTAPNDWAPLARSGRYADAYALARSAGVPLECARRGADDVLLLGETARLTDHVDDARLAYQTVRRRFAGSAAAGQAAFNLGRLEARAGNGAAAAGFFETYLREQPRGPLAQAALGRLLEARVGLGDTRAARETAASYLERYPAGPHAEAARKVLESETKR
jgi:TolA-binding protein